MEGSGEAGRSCERQFQASQESHDEFKSEEDSRDALQILCICNMCVHVRTNSNTKVTPGFPSICTSKNIIIHD